MCKCNKNFFRKYLLYIFLATCALSLNNTFCMQDLYNQEELATLENKAFEGKLDLIEKEWPELDKIRTSIAIKRAETDDNNLFKFLFESVKQALKAMKKQEAKIKFVAPKQELIKPELIKPELIKPELIKPELIKPELIKPESSPQKKETKEYFYKILKNINYTSLNARSIPGPVIAKISFNQKHFENIMSNLTKSDLDRIEKNKLDILTNNNKLTLFSQTSIPVLGKSCSNYSVFNMHLKSTREESMEAMLNAYNPDLCLFGECSCMPREIRNQFEEKVVKHESIKNFKNINYLGFSSGNLFPDLKILSDLILNENKRIHNIHLIDTIYDKDSIPNIKTSNADNPSEFWVNIPDFVLTPNKFLRIIQFTQFIKILSEFQKQPINLVIFENISAYKNYIDAEKNQNEKANLATIIDPAPDNFSELLNNIRHFGLQNNGLLCTIMRKDVFKNQVSKNETYNEYKYYNTHGKEMAIEQFYVKNN